MSNNNMQMLYCGNNRRHPDLLNRSKRLGTRYTCLQKGINVGLAMAPDYSYSGDYEPIDRTRKYCGNGPLPHNYDRFGTLVECLQKGVGIGKRRRSTNLNNSRRLGSPRRRRLVSPSRRRSNNRRSTSPRRRTYRRSTSRRRRN